MRGKFYVWKPRKEAHRADREEYAVAASHFGLDHRRISSPALAPCMSRAPSAGQGRDSRRAKQKLFAARAKRVRRDATRVLVSWNALAPRMARAGRVFGREPWIASARHAFEFIRSRMWRNGSCLATYKDGHAHLAPTRRFTLT